MKDTSLCDAAITWFEGEQIKKLQGPGTFQGPKGELFEPDNKVKESTDICLTFDEFAAYPVFHPIFNYLWDCVLEYANEFDYLIKHTPFEILPVIRFQKYEPPSGGYKSWHQERGVNDSIFLVWMIYLNDVKEGGGTSFKYLDHTEQAEKGKLILWPADFTHLHKGEIAPEETKYILTGWYQYH